MVQKQVTAWIERGRRKDAGGRVGIQTRSRLAVLWSDSRLHRRRRLTFLFHCSRGSSPPPGIENQHDERGVACRAARCVHLLQSSQRRAGAGRRSRYDSDGSPTSAGCMQQACWAPCTRRRARLASCLATAAERPTMGAILSNGSANISCSANPNQLDGKRTSRHLRPRSG